MRNQRRMLMVVSVTLLLLLIQSTPLLAQTTQASGVITTNYPDLYDTDAAPIRTSAATYGDYSNMETDPVSVSAEQRDSVLAKLKKELAQGINVLTLNRWQDAKEGLPTIQIVNNVPIQGALFTIYLPPNWQRSAHVPVVLSGDGLGDSNNNRLWRAGDTGLVGLVGLAGIPGFKPVIGVICNTGGTESMGTDEHTLKAIGAFFDFIGQNGGDPQHAVIYGASRGGLSALTWTINPLNLNYNVVAVFADNMPTAMGTLSQRSDLTYPNISYLYSTATHNSDLYKYSVPHGGGHFDTSIFYGTKDIAQVDSLSPIGLAEGLRGKVVVIGRGTHDPFTPFQDFVNFDHRLTALHIPHTTIMTLEHGHIGNWILLSKFADYVKGVMVGKPKSPTLGRYFYINLKPPDGTIVALSAFQQKGLAADPNTPAKPNMTMPFTAEIPLGAGIGLPVNVSVCGRPGAAYSYSAQDASGKVWTKGDGKFSADECVLTTIAAPSEPGDYAWTFTYQGKVVSSTNTPRRDANGCGLPATTHVTANQPSPVDLAAKQFALGDGVDQYDAQQPGCGT